MKVTAVALLLLHGSSFGHAAGLKSAMSPPEIGNLRGLQTNATDIPDDFNITDSNITIAKASKKDEGDPDSACCAGKENLKSLTFELTGGNCDASSNDQGRKFECYGDFPTDSSFAVKLYEAKFKSGTPQGPFNLGDTFTIVPDGSRFASDVEITIGGKQELTIHTSCSQPLNLGDIFGGVTLVDYNEGERTKDCQVFCRNTARAGLDENCPTAFPACIAPEDEAGEKCCVCQNTAGPFGADEGCGGATRPRLCFDGDKEPCFLEGGTQCLCIDDAKGGSRDSGCGNLLPLCGRLATNSEDSKFGEEATFPNVQGNLGNACFKCQKTTEFPTATDPDANCDENAPRCVFADDGELEDVGQLGFSCTTCQDVFYHKVTLTGAKNYDDAVDSAPDGCILTPIADTTELNSVASAAGSSECWVGIVTKDDPNTKTTRLARANNFENPASAQGVPVDPYPTITLTDINTFWNGAEPNNNPPTQTRATINTSSSGKLRDVKESDPFNCAIYKCCGAEK
mmetsp:Transcript_32199/g.58228  ORF Transcript_32199/g.58228 Transcript_32199/m.58228 type:complete len:513 (-) Transcript_32199:206-1744(-)|eukprot:CAMPEP_0202510856 /NCGR_PEP_ID=MMETSP1361-20130828/53510_1 /ASSEMBLY_ACC=CAM_ASM_000849 /TAXON_ID=210615 /ORGANISM="Staurosira complex sp., Strain CCMP2646" /LENGTH=512 /DNA_ID=CAMNT_0049145131 /DNA_START=900 /DNA_END=2438 /DNA_ORIENTATION=-